MILIYPATNEYPDGVIIWIVEFRSKSVFNEAKEILESVYPHYDIIDNITHPFVSSFAQWFYNHNRYYAISQSIDNRIFLKTDEQLSYLILRMSQYHIIKSTS